MKQESRIVNCLLRISWAFALVSCGPCVVPANAQQARTPEASILGSDEGSKWNTMGGGPAPIPEAGKLRVFVLMGQSNMHGTARARELQPPYTERHDRIRIWANGRWEYFVPTQRFGPGVSFAHQLAEFWPNDTIVHPGKLPRAADGVHFSSDGYIRLGKITASAVEEYYKKR